MEARVQRYGWDKAAEHYDGYWQRQLEPAQDLLLELAALEPGESVLELACGTGLVTLRVAEAVGPEGRVLATDISEQMVDVAREEASRRGVSNVTFERGDAEEPSADERRFDVALCSLGLMYVPDPVAVLSASFGSLKPGGRAVAAVWGERSRCGWADIFPIVDARVASEVCPMFFQLGSKDLLAKSFTRAGFIEVQTKRIDTRLRYASGEDACGAAFAGGPVALAYSKFDDKVLDEVHKEYLDSIEAFRTGDGYDVPGEFVVVAGRKARRPHRP